ncbi:TetR/AcrR family transcriptional regulator [Georgenia sunbinii]|uniref:TetR/AcrR family transcriptional regulator n=1 Tax=Georgenia sunbinii TaxID=3117728 RepID=UPI002F25FC66
MGRPRAVSRAVLEEAACELFLEQGYEATSVADITQRAGVSRATFFNYVPAKSDLLWTSVDDALDGLPAELVSSPTDDGAVTQSAAALLRVAARLEPGTVLLAFANAEPMGVAEELEESAARRQRRAARIIAGHLRARGLADLHAEVVGAAQAGAFLAALRAWSRRAPGRTPFPEVLGDALGMIADAGTLDR